MPRTASGKPKTSRHAKPKPKSKPAGRVAGGRIKAASSSTAESSARRVTRNDRPPAADDPPAPPAPSTPPEPRYLVRQQPKPPSTGARQRAARNLFDALGGTERIAPILRASGKPRAQRLADLLEDPKLRDATPLHKITTAGLNLADLTELLLDHGKATAVARLVMSADEVAEGILARATDQFKPHGACLASGRVLDEESGMPTEYACFGCQGSGYILESAEKEWVDLYLELIQLRKNAPLLAYTKNVTNQNLNVSGDLVTGDGAPVIDSIIKRADQQVLAMPGRALTDGSERLPAMSGMPEDQVQEAELVEAAG